MTPPLTVKLTRTSPSLEVLKFRYKRERDPDRKIMFLGLIQMHRLQDCHAVADFLFVSAEIVRIWVHRFNTEGEDFFNLKKKRWVVPDSSPKPPNNN